MNTPLITSLREQSTWRLFGLCIITYFVYAAYYIKRQTEVINTQCDPSKRINSTLITSIFITQYVSLLFFILYFFVDEGSPIETISSIADTVSGIFVIVWGFKARNRMNELLDAKSSPNIWFHGLWTFLFSPMYFNIKVNKIYNTIEQGAAANP